MKYRFKEEEIYPVYEFDENQDYPIGWFMEMSDKEGGDFRRVMMEFHAWQDCIKAHGQFETGNVPGASGTSGGNDTKTGGIETDISKIATWKIPDEK